MFAMTGTLPDAARPSRKPGRRSPFQILWGLFLAFLCAASTSSAAVSYTVGPGGDYATIDEAMGNLVPLQDDVVLFVSMGFAGYQSPMDLTEAGFNGYNLTVIPQDNTQTTVTYYFGEDLEYRVSPGGGVQEAIEYTEGGQFTQRQVSNSIGTPSDNEYYIKNNLGSTVALVGENGTAVGPYYDYHAYGTQEKDHLTAAAEVTHTYTGKEFDNFVGAYNQDGAGLYHFGARYYDADIGMWLAVDPEFETYSPYTFAAANPLAFTDADGRSVYTKLGKVIYKTIKTGDATAAFADNIQDAAVLFGSNATLGARVLAGFSLASELLPVSVGDLKDGLSIARKIHEKSKIFELTYSETAAKVAHGNSKLSTKAQHGYEIVDNSLTPPQVVKTGISGGKRTASGGSARANSQANRWNREAGQPGRYEGRVVKEIPSGQGARQKILEWEANHASQLREAGQLKDPTKHQRP